MRFEIYPPIIRNNVLTHIQNTSPYFTQEPHLFGRTARPGNPIVLNEAQFTSLSMEIKKLLSAQSCVVFAVNDEGEKREVTYAMMEDFRKSLQKEAEEDMKEEDAPPAEPPAPPAEPTPVVEPKPEVVEETSPAAEIPAPLMTPPTEESPVNEAPAVEEVKEEPAPEETTKKKGKGKKTQE